jgi:hypothetical protein
MTPRERELFEQMAGTLAQIKRDLARLQGRGHAEHRSQIVKGIIEPGVPACSAPLVREERSPGFPFARLMRPFGNGHHN